MKEAAESCRELPSCARKHPGRQCSFTVSTRDLADTLPDPSPHSSQARERSQGQGQCRDSAGEVPAAMQEEGYLAIHFSVGIFFCLGRSNTMGVIAASSQFLR